MLNLKLCNYICLKYQFLFKLVLNFRSLDDKDKIELVQTQNKHETGNQALINFIFDTSTLQVIQYFINLA